ncbi:MAG: co-chaperone GroES, partial [Cyclobacteriaceae bacterium]|nr:co-chaperone GroES [Cyclobacteriaceae bacterium]
MEISGDKKLRKIIVVGDRVLIKPKKMSERTESGLYL